MPRVEVLDDDDASVVSQLPVQLTVADVERNDANSTALQQDVSEATRRCADVQALAPSDLDVKGVERVRELQAAAPGIGVIRRQESDCRLIVDRGAGLGGGSIVDGDLPGEDQCARTFARRRESAFDDELIETDARHQRAALGSRLWSSALLSVRSVDDPLANRNQTFIVDAGGSKGRVGAFETFGGHATRRLDAVESG